MEHQIVPLRHANGKSRTEKLPFIPNRLNRRIDGGNAAHAIVNIGNREITKA